MAITINTLTAPAWNDLRYVSVTDSNKAYSTTTTDNSNTPTFGSWMEYTGIYSVPMTATAMVYTLRVGGDSGSWNPPAEKVPEKPPICPYCERKHAKGKKYCSGCGATLPQGT